MSTKKIDKKDKPDSEYRFFLFDPAETGFEYFKTVELRDDCAYDSIQNYLDDVWDEAVENIVVGEITGQSTKVNVVMKPTELDKDGCDEEGTHWEEDCDYTCDYKVCHLKIEDKS